MIQSDFIAIPCDGNTDSVAVDKENISVLFVDADTFQPVFLFLYLKHQASQDADVIVKAIKTTFSIHDLHHLLQVIGKTIWGRHPHLGGEKVSLVFLGSYTSKY